MELSELIFKSNTEDLERVSKVIGGLVTDISKLDKASRDAAKTEATLARAAKDNAKANLDNAKAQEASRKSVEATENAQRKAIAATEKNTSILQRQADIYDFLAQGYSKGQAGILATAKATGQYSKELEEILKLQKQFTADPFDRSDMALNRMIRSLKELKDAQSFTNQGMNLTTKQARELSNDLARLEASLKRQGKSYDEISKAQALHKQQFVEEAAALNRSQSAMDAVEKQRKEVVTATNYLTQADAKMAAALNTSNAALDKAGTDSLVKYESALRRSGVSQDVATQKLATYKAQLTQVAAAEEKRRSQHLARALTPQISDVVVSLWSGQSPMTVLLQQGAQVNDLFQLSGVAAADFGKTVKQAFTSMLPAIMTVVKGVGGLIVDGFMAAGKAVAGFLGNISGMTAAMNTLYGVMSQDGPSKWGGWIRGAGMLLSGIFATGVGAVVAGLIAFGVALKQVIVESNELNRAVALNGGTLGATAVIAETYVARLGAVTGSSSKANEALIAMAKAGNITSSSMMMVGEAAIALNKAVGVPIEETVKQFDKLATAPGKTLAELAKSTGLIKAETLELVLQYERVGQTSKAAEIAQKAYADASKSAATTVKENYGALTTFAMQVKSIFSGMWDTILGVGRADNLDTRIDQLRQRIIENSQATPGLFLTKERIEQDTKDLNAQFYVLVQQRKAQMDIGKAKADAVKASAAVVESEKLSAQYSSTVEKHQLEITKLQNQRAQWEKDGLLTKDRELLIAKGIAEEQKKINEVNKPKSSPSENYYATLMREATNNTIAANTATQELTKSEQKLLEVKADPRFAKLTTIQQADVIAKYDAAIAAERQTAMTEKLAEAEEHRLKLLGKSEGIGKQYYADMQKLEEFAKVAGWSKEEIEELTRAVFKQTPAWKAYEKALEDVNTTSKKFQEDSIASQASVLQENQSLDHRLSLLGRTAEEQKAITIEYQRANKIREVDIKLARQLREIEEKIAEAKKKGLPESDYKSLIDAEIQARKDAAEQHKVINREVAVQYAEDMQREIDAIKSGISDSIVTALFEGGKAGGKKLREVLVGILRQKVTIVVDAVVNTLVGNVVGSLMGGAGGQAGASLLGSAASSAAGSMLGGATGLLGSVGGALSGFTTAATASLQTMVGMTGTVAQMSTSLAAAGHTAAAGMQAGINAFQMIPGWGWALAAVGALAAIFGKKSTPHTGAGSTYSFAGGLQTGADQYGQYGFADTRNYNSETEKVTSSLAKSVVTMLDQTAKNFGMTAGYQAATAFADDTSKDGAWGSLVIEQLGKKVIDWSDSQVSKWAPKVFSDGEKGLKEYMNAVANSAIEALQKMDLPAWASRIAQTTELGTDNAEAALNNLFKALSEYPNQLLQLFGTSRDALVEKFTEGLASGNAMQAGQSVADVLVESIRNALYTNAAGQIFDIVNQGIVAPVLDAIVTGASVSEALSDASIQATIDRAKKQAQVLAELYGNTEFQAVLENLRVTVGSALGQAGTSIQTLPNTLYKVADAAEDTARAADDTARAAAAAATAAEELAQKEANLTRKRLEMYKQIYTLEGKQAEARSVELQLRQLELAAMDASLRPLQEMIYNLEDFAEKVTAIKNHLSSVSEEANRLLDFARSNTDKAYAVLERSVGKQLDIAKTAVETSTKVRDSLKGIFDLLSENIRALYREVDSTSAMLSSEGRSIITQAISSGIMPEQDKLSEAISAVRSGLDKTIYTTKFQADKARLLFGIELSNLQETAKDQLTEAERQLKASEDTVKYLEGVLTTAKAQIDALRGIDLSVINVETAINNLAAAILAEGGLQEAQNKLLLQGTGQAVYDVTSGIGTNAAGQVFERNALIEATQSHLAQGTTQAALDVYRAAASSGYSMSQLETIYGLPSGVLATEVDKLSQAIGVPLPTFASGGMHSGGLRIVGENGPELEATGPARIWNADQTASMLGGSSDSQTAYEVRALREENKAQARAIVQLQSRLTKIIERWDGEGMPDTRAV